MGYSEVNAILFTEEPGDATRYEFLIYKELDPEGETMFVVININSGAASVKETLRIPLWEVLEHYEAVSKEPHEAVEAIAGVYTHELNPFTYCSMIRCCGEIEVGCSLGGR